MAETMRPFATDDARWAAIERRDAAAVGRFYVAVRTTGIYCRPGCPARIPRRDNVTFFDSPLAAERAGFRPCKRCRPREAAPVPPIDRAIAAACRLLDEAEEPMTLAELARLVGVSAGHLQRTFKRAVGLSPRAYAATRRASRLRDELGRGEPVTSAIAGAGFGSASRVYEDTDGLLGMRPSAYRHGGKGEHVRYATAPTSLGHLLVAATERGVCAIDLDDAAEPLVERLHRRFPNARLEGEDPAFVRLVERVVRLVESPTSNGELPLDVRGTAFQGRVWQALRQIRSGETVSYAELAERIGSPGAVRAVANACGANPVPVAVPCHRVVRTNGDLGGYRLGIERKRALLERERTAVAAAGEGA